MKIIKYNLISMVNVGAEENPVWESRRGAEKTIRCSDDSVEANLEIARSEAFEEPEVIPVEEVEKITPPSQLDMIEAQVTYTAMMTDTLLEG